MDVLEASFSRLPSNWWHLISPPDNSHFDDISRYLPFPYEFMMKEFKLAGLTCRKSINMDKFNFQFKGQFEMTWYRKKGGKTCVFLRVCGKGPTIRHKPEQQVDGVAEVFSENIYACQPLMKRIRVGPIMHRVIRDFVSREMLMEWAQESDDDSSMDGSEVGISLDPPNFEAANSEESTGISVGRGVRTDIKMHTSYISKYKIEPRDERHVISVVIVIHTL